jgi:hypothetical protein
MIAYSKSSLEKSRIKETSEKWNKKELISKGSFEKITENYKPDLYTPNFFIRIALFVFTIILANAGLGFITLITMWGSDEAAIGVRMIIYGILVLVALEVIIHDKKIYRAGIDDALLYIGLGYFITGITIIIFTIAAQSGSFNPEQNDLLICLVFAFPILLAATIRYTDMLVAAITYCCLFAIMFLILNQAGEIVKALLPFAGIIFSGLAYFLIKKYKLRESLIEWEDAMIMIEILSLFTFYFSGNYLVVRELSEMLFDKKLLPGEDIPLAIVFYLFTSLIPVYYIYKAVHSKDRIMLRIGLIIFTLAVLTFKYYYSLGHHEISLTIAGIALISVAWLLMKYLKTPRYGLTTKEDTDGASILNTDIETVIIAEGFKTSGQEKGFDFGGGKFGGGGAGSNY